MEPRQLPPEFRRRRPKLRRRRTGVARVSSILHRLGCGWVLRRAGTRAHRTVVVAVPVMAGTDDGELVSGGRSSGGGGFGATSGGLAR